MGELNKFTSFSYPGMTFSSGENWKVMRRFTISSLKDFGMGRKTIEDRISEECDCLVKEIKSFKGISSLKLLLLQIAFH